MSTYFKPMRSAVHVSFEMAFIAPLCCTALSSVFLEQGLQQELDRRNDMGGCHHGEKHRVALENLRTVAMRSRLLIQASFQRQFVQTTSDSSLFLLEWPFSYVVKRLCLWHLAWDLVAPCS